MGFIFQAISQLSSQQCLTAPQINPVHSPVSHPASHRLTTYLTTPPNQGVAGHSRQKQPVTRFLSFKINNLLQYSMLPGNTATFLHCEKPINQPKTKKLFQKTFKILQQRSEESYFPQYWNTKNVSPWTNSVNFSLRTEEELPEDLNSTTSVVGKASDCHIGANIINKQSHQTDDHVSTWKVT